MYCDSSSPQILNSTITGCTGGGEGGGMHCRNASSPKITNSTITKCSAFGSGGGIYCIYFSSPEILSCNIIDNAVDGWGAGISCLYGSKPKIINCLIRGNNNVSGGAGGAGIYCRNSSSATITGCMITQNSSADNSGGGILCSDTSSPNITNCTIANNSASNYGGGIYCTNRSYPSIINSILWGNYATGGLDQVNLSSTTCTLSVTWSDVQGGSAGIGGSGVITTYTDNIDSYPDFSDSVNGDFGLELGSPCINAGRADTNGLSLPPDDVSGNARISEGRIDMGADEYNVFEVSGNITSDTIWNADVVSVTGHVSVFNGVTLTIPAGAYVEFKGHYKLMINGRLLAEGTAQDSIIFTAENTTTGWYGIRFSNTAATNDSSRISYCRMEYGKATGTASDDKRGGALFLENFSKLAVSHTVISNNSAVYSGGGIYCNNASPVIRNCRITDNSAPESGGGILCAYVGQCPRVVAYTVLPIARREL
jgi:predicted outer membrane repeat protein